MIVDLFHDTVCPWCRIGKRHLEIALETWEGGPVEVRHRAFFLDPTIPSEGRDFRAHMHAKGGGQVPLERFFDGPRRMGVQAGLRFNFEAIERAPNTLLSHQLIALTPAERRGEMVDALYAAYFERGEDIGDMLVLTEIAAGEGLDPDRIREALETGAGREQVDAEARWAQQHGIQGVPFFLFKERYALQGAQPPGAILEALQRVAEGALPEAPPLDLPEAGEGNVPG